jgi:hypothetical protein
MKKLTGILAIILAVGVMAFTKAGTTGNITYYWYHTQDDGTVINPGAPPPSSPLSDPFNCGGGPVKICGKAFNDYDHTTFAPLGSVQQTVKRPN